MPDFQTMQFSVDGLRLVGSLHLPAARNPPVVIGCHGLLANRESPKQTRLAALCNAHGIAYFRFDHRGCGDSQGRFAEVTSLSARCRDLYQAMRLMETHPRTGPLLCLFGSSFGGAVALGVAARQSVPAIVTFAAPIYSLPDLPEALQQLSNDVDSSPDLLENLKFDLRPCLAAVSNILIVHGDCDDVVRPAHAHELLARCSSPKKLQLQTGGDHPMSSPEHQRQFAASFIDWVSAAAKRSL